MTSVYFCGSRLSPLQHRFHFHQLFLFLETGFVMGLDYKNPYLNPYKTFQQYKHHPAIASVLEGGTCVKYGGTPKDRSKTSLLYVTPPRRYT